MAYPDRMSGDRIATPTVKKMTWMIGVPYVPATVAMAGQAR